jgi:hypothetical protein
MGTTPTGNVEDRAMSNQILGSGESPGGVASVVSGRRPFPLRTLIVCFTVWLITTEVLVFDQVKFDAKAELLEQATRALRGPQVLVPTERPSSVPADRSIERL